MRTTPTAPTRSQPTRAASAPPRTAATHPPQRPAQGARAGRQPNAKPSERRGTPSRTAPKPQLSLKPGTTPTLTDPDRAPSKSGPVTRIEGKVNGSAKRDTARTQARGRQDVKPEDRRIRSLAMRSPQGAGKTQAASKSQTRSGPKAQAGKAGTKSPTKPQQG